MMELKEHLSNKKILFLSVQTFNLEVEIKKKLEELGAHVTYYDERPANNNFIKGIIRLNRSLVQKRIDKYYKKIFYTIADKNYDYLFVNRGEIVPEFFLKDLKNTQPNCQFIFYTWDSFENHNHPTTILKYFDKKSTFDPKDAFQYKINFRPLFYLDAFKNMTHLTQCYDVLFLGTAHSDRYKISSLIKAWAQNYSLNCFCFYYMHGKFVYLYKYFFDKSFKEFKYSQLSFKSLNLNQIVNLYQQSNVILDINHPHQKGLTMRTFEAIGAKRKLITTNNEISKYPFYNENNFLIIDREDIKLSLDFFIGEYKELDSKLYEKFSLEGWLFNIFVDAEESFWNKCL
jgi:hypothetical protein